MTMILLDVYYDDIDVLLSLPIDSDTRKARVIENPSYIPHIGEKVFMGYTPATEVIDVIYDYTHNVIVVKGK